MRIVSLLGKGIRHVLVQEAGTDFSQVIVWEKFADFMTKNQFLASWQLESSSARKLLALVTKKSASPALLLSQLVNPRNTQHSEGPSMEVFVQYGASTTLPTTCKE